MTPKRSPNGWLYIVLTSLWRPLGHHWCPNPFFNTKNEPKVLPKWLRELKSTPKSDPEGPQKFKKWLQKCQHFRDLACVTSVSLCFHFVSPSGPLRFCFDFTSISRRCHFDRTSISLWSHFDLTSNSFRIHFDFTPLSRRFHFDYTSITLRFRFVFTSNPCQCYFNFTSSSLRF